MSLDACSDRRGGAPLQGDCFPPCAFQQVFRDVAQVPVALRRSAASTMADVAYDRRAISAASTFVGLVRELCASVSLTAAGLITLTL